MRKRKNANLEAIEPEIIAMRKEGMTRQEIADFFGLDLDQIRWWVTRYNRKLARLAAGEVLRPKGRPRKEKTP